MFWTLIFVIAHSDMRTGAASVVVDFRTKEACMVAQTALIEQARQKNRHILAHMCVQK